MAARSLQVRRESKLPSVTSFLPAASSQAASWQGRVVWGEGWKGATPWCRHQLGGEGAGSGAPHWVLGTPLGTPMEPAPCWSCSSLRCCGFCRGGQCSARAPSCPTPLCRARGWMLPAPPLHPIAGTLPAPLSPTEMGSAPLPWLWPGQPSPMMLLVLSCLWGHHGAGACLLPVPCGIAHTR